MNDQEYSKHRDGKTWCNMCIRSSTLPCCFFRWLSCYMGKALTTAFIFISTWKWIGKSSFCKLYGFFLNLLYFEAIFGNLVMLWKKPKQLYFYISNSIFYISTWGWAGKFKRSASNPSPSPTGGPVHDVSMSMTIPRPRPFQPHPTWPCSCPSSWESLSP